ncbi:PH domain-containing protein [Patescibacteria group bacterium]|nr:PH domain-containing protein [Patescibacteria group bacterium]
MATLLLKINGYYALNKTLFPPNLYIYDDLVVYKKRKFFFWGDEITYSYNQIAQVSLKTGLLFSHLELSTTGKDEITVKYVFKWKAKLAKKIIDQKIYHAHAKMHPHKDTSTENYKNMTSFEKALSRLEELALRGKISKSFYKKKKNELLKKIG